MWKTTDRYVQQVRKSESPLAFQEKLFYLPLKPNIAALFFFVEFRLSNRWIL